MEQPIIHISGLKKSFGDLSVLENIEFNVYKGDVVCLIGSSGSGKSTLLRCVNLLEVPDGGIIEVDGQNILEGSINVNRYRARVGMVFQSFNLFNNMTVLKNCMIAQMKVLHRSREEAEAKALHYLELVGML